MNIKRPVLQPPPKIISIILAAVFVGAGMGCALFETLKPALLPAALTLLEQLDLLLLEYESAELPLNASEPEFAQFSTLQDARHAVLTDRLTHCAPNLSKSELLDYQTRITLVSSTVP